MSRVVPCRPDRYTGGYTRGSRFARVNRHGAPPLPKHNAVKRALYEVEIGYIGFRIVPYLLATLTAVLLYFAGARAFGNARQGLLVSGVFAATPLLWVAVLSLPRSLYPLPFVAAWLAALVFAGDTGSIWWYGAAGLALGLGTYTSDASIVMMPIYLAIGLVAIVAFQRKGGRHAGTLIGAFAAATLPLAVFFLRDPDRFRGLIMAHRLYDAQRFGPLQGVREMTSWIGLTARSEMYYDFFNPAFLFLSGRILLLPLVVLVPLGLYRIATTESGWLGWVSTAGFLAAPFAAVLTAERPMAARILPIIPFAAIVSTYAIKHLFSTQDSRRRRPTDVVDHGDERAPA